MAVTEESIAARRVSFEADLEAARRRLELASSEGRTPPESLRTEVELLERAIQFLNQQSTVLRQIDDSFVAKTELDAQLESLRLHGPLEPRPWSLLLLDEVQDELDGQNRRFETIQAAEANAQAAYDSSRKTRDEREAARRQAQEAVDRNKDEAAASALAVALRQANLESELALETLQLRKLELDLAKSARQNLETQRAFLNERVRLIAAGVTFRADDLQSKTLEIDARRSELQRQLEFLTQSEQYFNNRWMDSKGRSDAAGGADVALLQEVESWKVAFQARQREIRLLNDRIARLKEQEEAWDRRYRLMNGQRNRQTIAEWRTEAEQIVERLTSEMKLQQMEVADSRNVLVNLSGKIESAASDPNVLRWLKEQERYEREIASAFEENISSIESSRRIVARLLAELRAEEVSVSWGERIAGIWSWIRSVWTVEVTSIDDKSITVGKIIIGLFLLCIGMWLSRFLSNILGRRILPRVGVNEGAAAAFRSLAFYVLLTVIVLIALRVVNVPLTAFTILGGALAIGFGFGSQNIINNFISGLIILAERPIRVGDLIEVGDLLGTVEHIGARSTRVRTGSNVEILVPNSSFLENNVMNWTLSETKVRVSVSVGVAYGSPTRDVRRLLQQAVAEHGRVSDSPTPIVLFRDFGDNALQFEVHFWIKMRKQMDRYAIESDIRFRIDNLFHEAGITIAFPQRDVHLDTSGPLSVRMLAPETAEREASEG